MIARSGFEMTSSRLRVWRCASVVLGIALICYVTVRHFVWNDLRAQKASLQQEADGGRALQAEIETLRKKVASEADILALRREIVAVEQARRGIKNLERALSVEVKDRTPLAEPPGPPPPRRAWRNAGQMSPEATIETLVWATSSGSVENLKSTLLLSPSDEAQVASLYAGLPEATKVGYGSPANLFATLLTAKMPTDLSDYEILDQREQNGGLEVNLVLTTGWREGSGKRAITLLLQHQATGWKIQVPTSQVKAVLGMVKPMDPQVK